LPLKGQFCKNHKLWERGLFTGLKKNGDPSVICSGEAIFDYEYLRDLEITNEMFLAFNKRALFILGCLLSMIP
jgi:hypothetical protein